MAQDPVDIIDGGEVAERLNAAVSKTVMSVLRHPGFESLPLRQPDNLKEATFILPIDSLCPAASL